MDLRNYIGLGTIGFFPSSGKNLFAKIFYTTNSKPFLNSILQIFCFCYGSTVAGDVVCWAAHFPTGTPTQLRRAAPTVQSAPFAPSARPRASRIG